MVWIVQVNADKCTGDGECVNICPAAVLEIKNEKAVTVNNDCVGCKSCEAVCPSGAIAVSESQLTGCSKNMTNQHRTKIFTPRPFDLRCGLGVA